MLPLHPSQKQKITLALPAPLIERLRNAVYWTGHRSLVSLIEVAIEELVTEMEDINKEPFPQRLSPLKRGRRQGKLYPAPMTTAPRQHEHDLLAKAKEREQSLRKNMADDILQSLFAVGLNLEALTPTTPLQNGKTAEASLQQAIGQLNRAIQELRGLMHETGS